MSLVFQGFPRFAVAVMIMQGVVVSCSCVRDQDETAIRGVLERVRSRVEQKAFSEALEELEEDYRDNLGQQRGDVLRHLKEILGPYDRLEVHVAISKIERDAVSAKVITKIKVDGIHKDMRERVFGSPIHASEVHVDLEKRKGAWRIVGCSVVQQRGMF